MRVLPVLDILDGHVVHGVAGRRSEYRPIESRWTGSSQPLDVANAMRDVFGLNHLYIADLDGILTQKPNRTVFRCLVETGFELIIDAGVQNVSGASLLRDEGVTRIIVGLETCRSPEDLADIARTVHGITFSLDLRGGVACRSTDSVGWSEAPRVIIRQAAATKVDAILPLDLSDVGMGTGGSTMELCRFIRREFPQLGLITGGGVRGREDLKRFSALGVDEVLVASALHDGRLTAEDLCG